jgi:hypothetical protein
VERLFKTLQDRLVKELRLAGIATIKAAHRFVEEWLPLYNQRCTIPPAQATDLHRPGPAHRELDRSLCLKTTCCLRKDWTVAHHGQLYPVRTNVRATHVMVEERVDGTRRIMHHGRPLDYRAIPARPERVAEPPTAQVPRHPVTPRPDHPWRRRLRPERRTPARGANT